MRRGLRQAVVALAVSLLLHAALLGGLALQWPSGDEPAPPPVFEARLIAPPPPPPQVPAPPRPRPAPAPAPLPQVVPPPPVEDPAPEPEPVAVAVAVAVAEPVPEAAAPAAGVAPAVVESSPPVPAPVLAPPPAPPLNALPPRIDLRYDVRYGIAAGEQTLVWVNEGERYTLTSVASATGLAGLLYRGRFVQTSRGRVTPGGLQPEEFWDQRGARRASARLDAGAGEGVLTTARGEVRHFAYPPGMQDALSLFFQIALTAPPAGPQRLAVFNGKKVRTYVLEPRGEETLDGPLGPLRTLHLARAADADGRFEAWLAVDRHYLPVRVIRSDDEGNTVELSIRSIAP